jgi:hypothetical protein
MLGQKTPGALQPPQVAQELSLDQQKALAAEPYRSVTQRFDRMTLPKKWKPRWG